MLTTQATSSILCIQPSYFKLTDIQILIDPCYS